ncbi:MAG: DegT/DnrJ/EryC1/StrS family aminotransferase [Lachnospiraceae bacterium]|nr:DegT/DnrJ/EryC1/StrS family aminotransferase [Lachnospiraceae bacterium]
MQFRDLKKQYEVLKPKMDAAILEVLEASNYISGRQVSELEQELSAYVGVKHCITCANGTDALSLALMVWGIGEGDAVFVPDFTFFSSAETAAYEGATPVFTDILEDTFNMDPDSLERAIQAVIKEGKLRPRVIVTVDLFGLPADYERIRKIADQYGLYILEDAAQGFGGRYHGKRAGSFGDISTTSFFPAKPLGCYGDGGAVFTDRDDWAELLRSYRIHGKGHDKYDNVRIGMNSRLDTLQAAILKVKLQAFQEYELADTDRIARKYGEGLKDCVKVPAVPDGLGSGWAQYSILLKDEEEREQVEAYLKEQGVPCMIYYPRGMHQQTVFSGCDTYGEDFPVTASVCGRVLALPLSPYLTGEDQQKVIRLIREKTGAGV